MAQEFQTAVSEQKNLKDVVFEVINQSMILFVLQLTCWISYNKHRINLHNTQYKIK